MLHSWQITIHPTRPNAVLLFCFQSARLMKIETYYKNVERLSSMVAWGLMDILLGNLPYSYMWSLMAKQINLSKFYYRPFYGEQTNTHDTRKRWQALHVERWGSCLTKCNTWSTDQTVNAVPKKRLSVETSSWTDITQWGYQMRLRKHIGKKNEWCWRNIPYIISIFLKLSNISRACKTVPFASLKWGVNKS